jgi:hypothetical protein
MSYPLAYPKFRAFSTTTNLPLVGGKLYAYLINTTTAKPVYSDPELTTPITQPVILDSNGEATIYGSGLYDLKLNTSADVLVWTADSVAFDQAASTTVNTSLEWVGTITTGIVYLSTTSFSLTGDQTATWHANRRVKIVLTASTLYGTITTAVYTSVTTVIVVLDSGTLSDSITSVSIGILDSSNGSVPRTIPWLALANTFAGTNAFSAAVTMASTLAVTGATATGPLTVTGAASTTTTLAVGTALTVATTAGITGNTTVGGTLGVTGALTASAALTANSLGVNVAAPAAGVIQNSGNIEAGGYVYAPNGFKQPGTGGETLKTIRGIISSAGAILKGTGFTSVRNSAGNFTITFSTAFSDTPSCMTNGVHTLGVASNIISASTAQVNYALRQMDGSFNFVDVDHHFIITGPK